jgi:hypothetical protein
MHMHVQMTLAIDWCIGQDVTIRDGYWRPFHVAADG